MREGDEVVVNVAALDLGLGSGGFDVVHVNLTRGLEGGGVEGDAHVMKLNYTSLQHPVDPIERPVAGSTPTGSKEPRTAGGCRWRSCRCTGIWRRRLGRRRRRRRGSGRLRADRRRGAARLLLPRRSRAARARPARRARHRRARLRRRARGAQHGRRPRRRRRSSAGTRSSPAPAPGSSAPTPRSGTAAWPRSTPPMRRSRLGLPTLLSPRLSCADPRERHLGSQPPHPHRPRTCCSPGSTSPSPRRSPRSRTAARGVRPTPPPARRRADLDGYAASGLPSRTMGRSLTEDPLFFAAPLAAGAALRCARSLAGQGL